MSNDDNTTPDGKDFEAQVRIRYGFNHPASTFQWAVPPTCRCGWLASAFSEDAIFVQNVVDHADDGELYNLCYAYMVTGDGDLVDAGRGTPMRYCPCCGDPIKVRKVY